VLKAAGLGQESLRSENLPPTDTTVIAIDNDPIFATKALGRLKQILGNEQLGSEFLIHLAETPKRIESSLARPRNAKRGTSRNSPFA
jgi:hypothetical protein